MKVLFVQLFKNKFVICLRYIISVFFIFTKINQYRFIHILNIKNNLTILQLKKIFQHLGNLSSFRIIENKLRFEYKKSILLEYGNEYETQVAFYFLKKINFLQKNLFSKLLRIDKKKFYVFDYVEKNYNCSVEVRKIYKQDYKEFLFILKKFKLLGFNNKHLKSYNICNRTFKFETINFFRTRYFFQIMHDEIFLLKKIKIYVNFNYNNSISIQTNNFNKEKENILSTKLYIYKLFSLPKIFINIKIQNKNLCKKLYETSELVLNFTWYIKKNVMNFFL